MCHDSASVLRQTPSSLKVFLHFNTIRMRDLSRRFNCYFGKCNERQDFTSINAGTGIADLFLIQIRKGA